MRSILLAAFVVIFVVPLLGQQPDQNSLAFDVASVKQNVDSNASPGFLLKQGGGVTITAFPLFRLMRIAYSTTPIGTDGQILGGPGWLKTDRFDIVAKADPGSLEADETGAPTRLIAMLRSLLAERFRLRTHTEYREASVYLLELANKDRTLGPQLRPSRQDCRGPVANLVPPDASRWCGWRGSGTGHYSIQGFTMAEMAGGFGMTWTVGTPVLDRTGLAGRWDAQIDFVPTFVSGPNPESAPVPNPAADSGPDMLSAVRDQLGLKLQRGKAKVEYLVIDHVERPTPD